MSLCAFYTSSTLQSVERQWCGSGGAAATGSQRPNIDGAKVSVTYQTQRWQAGNDVDPEMLLVTSQLLELRHRGEHKLFTQQSMHAITFSMSTVCRTTKLAMRARVRWPRR